MILTEKAMLKILREEFENRLREYVNEEIQLTYDVGGESIDVWKDAQQCKVVHDESGIMYTFAGYEDDKVKLYLPDEPRFLDGHKGNKLLTSEPETFNDSGDDIEYELDPEALNSLPSDDEEYNDGDTYYESDDLEDRETQNSDDRDYILINKEEFVKQYSLA